MILFRQKRQLIALWSCVLVLFSTLAPVISQTLAARGDHDPMMVVCSALNSQALSTSYSGSKYMPLSLKTAAESPADSAHANAHRIDHHTDHAALDTTFAALADPTEHEHEEPAHGMVHCPYCNLMQHSPAFLAGNAPQLLSGNLRYAMPALYYHAPRPLFAWAATQPRGPPTLS